jgi:hypothetical protein
MTHASHLKGYVHAASASIGTMNVRGNTQLPQMTDQDRTHRIIATQKIPAPDDQRIWRGREIGQFVLPPVL